MKPGGFLVSESLPIASRLNLPAEIGFVRESVESGDPIKQMMAVRTLRDNIGSAVSEFQIRQRIYSHTIHVVRRRIDGMFVDRARYFDPRDRNQALKNSNEIDLYDDIFTMQYNHIAWLEMRIGQSNDETERRNYRQMLARAQTHLQSFKEIIYTATGVLENQSLNGAVFLLSSLPPLREYEAQGLGVDSRNGYALNGFYRVRRINDSEIYIDFRNFRSELSAWHHLLMMNRVTSRDSMASVRKLINPLVSSLDILKTPVLLKARYMGDELDQFLDREVYVKMKSKILDLVFFRHASRERSYLASVLSDAEIVVVMKNVQVEVNLVEKAMTEGASVEDVTELLSRLQRAVEHNAAILMQRKDPSKTYEQHRDQVRQNSTAKNPDCPPALRSETKEGSVQLEYRNGKYYLDGEEVEVRDIKCFGLKHGEPCKWSGKNVREGKLLKCCPSCGWMPCFGNLVSAWEKQQMQQRVGGSQIVGDESRRNKNARWIRKPQKPLVGAVRSVTNSSQRIFVDENGRGYTLHFGIRIYVQDRSHASQR